MFETDLQKSQMDDLVRYAMSRGAADAVAIAPADVIVDPRVRLKCLIPRCYKSGTCHHCPPHGLSTSGMQARVSEFAGAVFFRIDVKSEIIAADDLTSHLISGVMDVRGDLVNLGAHYMLNYSIVRLLQRRARSAGLGKTMGFGAGPCSDVLCHMQPACTNLLSGGYCRNANLSAPSMEASGMDVFTMAARVGWEVYPIGGRLKPGDVPHGALMGLVLVAPGTGPGEPRQRPAPRPQTWTARARNWLRREDLRLKALDQHNMLKQTQNIWRERKVWIRLIKNFRELESGWLKGLNVINRLFAGIPKPRPNQPR
jgi:predicted metal-binding protein